MKCILVRWMSLPGFYQMSLDFTVGLPADRAKNGDQEEEEEGMK